MKKVYMTSSQGEFFYLVKLPYIHEIEVASSPDKTLQSGDWVLAETRYGLDLVRVLGKAVEQSTDSEVRRHQGRIIRYANQEDFEDDEYNKQMEENYATICKEKIAYRGLNMKLINVHIMLGRSKVLIFFTAEQRVDFRELVRDLVGQFHTRIELRQIGVRDETRSLGGIAMCGREYCCHRINDQIKPATIKMVKDQELSLNSSKISGNCGRLLCCLSYEYDYYEEVRSELPDENALVYVNDTAYKVIEIHTLTREVSLLNCQDQVAKPLRMKADRLTYNADKKYWMEQVGKSPKMVMTSCGCTKPEGTRCKGCSAKE